MKDSGDRQEYEGGFIREPNGGRPRFELILPDGIPFEHQLLTRWAEHMAKGAEKYADRNWEKATGKEALDRFKESAFRHFMQWYLGEDDEDHAASVLFNINGWEAINYKDNWSKVADRYDVPKSVGIKPYEKCKYCGANKPVNLVCENCRGEVLFGGSK